MFVCPIITHEPLERFVLNFDWATRKHHVVKHSYLSGSTVKETFLVYIFIKNHGNMNDFYSAIESSDLTVLLDTVRTL